MNKKTAKILVAGSMFVFAIRQMMLFNDVWLALYLLTLSFCVWIAKENN